MALTYSAIGRVDQPANLVGASANTDLALRVADVTIGTVTADYTVGTGIALTASSLGVSAIVAVTGATVRSSANAQRALVGQWDSNLGGLRLYLTGTAVSIGLKEIATSDLGAGDIVRLVYVGA